MGRAESHYIRPKQRPLLPVGALWVRFSPCPTPNLPLRHSSSLALPLSCARVVVVSATPSASNRHPCNRALGSRSLVRGWVRGQLPASATRSKSVGGACMCRKGREGGGGGRGAGPGDHQQKRQGSGADALSMNGGLREVSVSVWCLLFLPRPQFLHSQTDPSGNSCS
jgi:hypothetical protein